jgi:hypothetical protein
MSRVAPAALAACWLLLGCQDDAGSHGAAASSTAGAAGSTAGGTSAVPASCDTRPRASLAPLRMLIHGEYERTLREVFGDAAVETTVIDLARISDQKPAHGFRTMALGTTGGDVEARFQVSDQLAKTLAEDPRQLTAVAACAGTPPLSDACVTELLTSLGLRLFRRQLTAAEQSWIQSVYQDGSAIAGGDGIRFAIFALLESPHFLYRPEISGTPLATAPGTLTLSGYELASRLSFLIWGSAPDAALLSSAASGSLDTEAGLSQELERLLSGPRARGQLLRFFQQWLEFEQLPIVNQAGPFLGEIQGEGLADAMQKELSETLLGIALDDKGKLSDLFTSDLAFVESPELAKLYGVMAPASGSRTALDPQRRGGLLTRAALLLTSGETTSPIRRGAFVKRKLLCDAIPSPDPNSFPAGAIQPPDFDENATSRQRWTSKTGDSQCNACHSQFNPFGFALENYDAIGRYRDTEPIIDPGSGVTLRNLPIDASIDVTLDSEPIHASDAVELGRALAESPRVRACFATQWLRFGAGRHETESDACVLADVVSSIDQDASLLDALERVVLAPEFRLRKLGAP